MTDPIIDRDAIIEKAAKAAWGTVEDDPLPWEKASKLAWIAARVAAKDALQSIADDLLAPIEALHETRVVFDDAAMTTGHRECSCGIAVQPGDLDCPTAQAVAAIREAVRA